MSRRTACPSLVCLLVAVAAARAAAPGRSQNPAETAEKPPQEVVEIAAVRVGFASRYKVGVWTPVEVTLRGAESFSGELSLTVPDGDGVPSRVFTDRPVNLAPGQTTRVSLLVRFGRVEGTLLVELRDAEGNVVAQRRFAATDQTDLFPAVGAGRRLIITVGAQTEAGPQGGGNADPLGVDQAVAVEREPAERRTVVANVADARELPVHWLGYEGVDTLVLSTSRPEVFRDLTLFDARVEAIDQWVRMGGTLIVCVGAQASEVATADGSLAPLARLLPGTFDGEARQAKLFTLRQTGSLESYCEAAVPVPAGPARPAIQVAKLIDLEVGSLVGAREADLPLVVRATRGFGRVAYFAGDLDRAPLADWADRPRLVARLLGLAADAEADDDAERGAVMHQGFDDLTGQLRSALDQFEHVGLVPFWIVVALVAVYLLLIGPGDYFLLRKIFGRMEWTWLTFPLIVLVFCTGAYFVAHRLKGDQLRVNQVDLIDVVVDDAPDGGLPTGLVRGTSWMNVFSPRSAAFDFEYRPTLPDGTEIPDATVSLAWQGLPGRFLGGMDPRASSPQPPAGAYAFSPNRDAMRGVPVQVWSTKCLGARWMTQTQRQAFPVAQLHDEGQVPVGEITNRLDFPLVGCFLVYRGQAYTLPTADNRAEPSRLGSLRPGESTAVDSWTWRTELRTLLTGKRLVKDDRNERQVATPYNQSSVDLSYILRIMMFFDTAGGRRYAELGNDYQPFVDLTHLLDADQAILVARGPDAPGQAGHGAQLVCGDPNDPAIKAQEDTHLTFYRFVFRVKQGTTP